MKEQILKLRTQGKSYKDIVKELGCSIATVSYHCGKGQKDKVLSRGRKLKATNLHIVKSKVDTYVSRIADNAKPFNKIHIKRGKDHQALVDKILSNPVCYLTGRTLDLADRKSFSIDHIIPFHISADNSITNAGLSSRDANMSKAHLTLEEYILLCKEVLEYNGYTVTTNY